MWFMTFAFVMWHNMTPAGATRGKFRIPDGMVSEWYIFKFGALKVLAIPNFFIRVPTAITSVSW
jgi:hypothetical protein